METIPEVRPLIVSASRATDIPAFYAKWFFDRLEAGYCVWVNPFSGKGTKVSFDNLIFVVFWTKDPSPLEEYLPLLQAKGIGFYIQYTINDYGKEGLESGVPPLKDRIASLKRISLKYGKDHVVWRFDPLILMDGLTVGDLLDRVCSVGEEVHRHVEKFVFSFADIGPYRKVRNNLRAYGIPYREWDEESMVEFAKGLGKVCSHWKIPMETCAEKADLSQFGIRHGKCIDDDNIIRIAHSDAVLMEYLGVTIHDVGESLFPSEDIPHGAVIIDENHYVVKGRINKDRGQRKFCGCAPSKDIGRYDTCPHLCKYCYANSSEKKVSENFRRHLENPFGETITGK